MINIAILVYDLINNYNTTVINGISSYFKNKNDVRLIITPVNLPHSVTSGYDYQYWTSTKLLQTKSISGIIVITNSFTNQISKEKLEKELAGFYGKPVVCVAEPLNIPDSKYTKNSCEKAYNQVVEHLKNKHNCKNFAFFTAGFLENSESNNRLEAYKKALKNNHLEFNPELVFDGDFTPGTAEHILAKKYKTKADIDFDAMLCVNDFTAGGCLLHFNKLGVKVPEDVKLFGFDDSDFSLYTYPTLSTISQTVPQSGYIAAEMLYKTIKNEQITCSNVINSFPIYRQSCGCISSKIHSTSYYDQNGHFFEADTSRQQKEMDVVQKHQVTLEAIYTFLNAMNTQTSLENFTELIKPNLTQAHISALMFCTYENPIMLSPDDDFVPPEKVKVQAALSIEDDTGTSFDTDSGIPFKLEDNIAPEKYERILNGKYFLTPIYIHNKNYGYILSKSNSDEYILMSINLKILSDIFVNSYEYSIEKKEKEKLLQEQQNLSLRAKTDELTQVFNRRGIMEYGQKLIDFSVSMNKTGLVFFCDLDGLKKINDTYGHKIGDLAIQTQAKVLKKLFRESDLVGRLSGDEFCVITPGFPMRKIDAMREKLKILNKEFSEEVNLPFTLSISMGAAEFDLSNTDLQTLLQQADKHLYEEKQIKHGTKK